MDNNNYQGYRDDNNNVPEGEARFDRETGQEYQQEKQQSEWSASAGQPYNPWDNRDSCDARSDYSQQSYDPTNTGYQQPYGQGNDSYQQSYGQPNVNDQQPYRQGNGNDQQPYGQQTYYQAGQQPFQQAYYGNQGAQYAGRPQGERPPRGPVGINRSPLSVILLSFVTCGIYGIVWLYKVVQEINAYMGREQISTGLVIGGIFCFPLIYIAYYKIDEALFLIDQQEGRPAENNFLLWILLSLVGVGFILAMWQIQEKLNMIWGQYGGGQQAY